MKAPFTCKFCGMPSYIDPSDQCMPPDYCHESDHGNREDYLAEQRKAARESSYDMLSRLVKAYDTRFEVTNSESIIHDLLAEARTLIKEGK